MEVDNLKYYQNLILMISYLENGVLYVAVDDAKYLDEKQVDGVDKEGGIETQETPVRYV